VVFRNELDPEIWIDSEGNSLTLKVWLSVIFMGNNKLQVINFLFLYYYLCRRSKWDLRTSQYPLHLTDIWSEEPTVSCANKPPSDLSVWEISIDYIDYYGFGQGYSLHHHIQMALGPVHYFLLALSTNKVAGSWSLLQRSKKLRILLPHPLHNSAFMFVCVHLMTQAPYCAYGDKQNFMLEIHFDFYQLCFNTTGKNSAGGPLC
jgi:hypothetical protein